MFKPDGPRLEIRQAGDARVLALAGHWTIEHGSVLEQAGEELLRLGSGLEATAARRVEIDLAAISVLDTAGAWVIDKARSRLAGAGIDAAIRHRDTSQATLLKEAEHRSFEVALPAAGSPAKELLSDVGQSVYNAWRDFVSGVSFLGQVVYTFARVLMQPARLRMTSIVYHIENFAFRGLPIIALINFLVGCIVAQQGIFQLQQFGATAFAVDLIGILVLRELAVLLTAIMIAGRSGSAITAELGSMKMREEIDALRVMGLDPIEVLVLPRILALIISLPILTFLADISALFGGLLVSWAYGDISPEVFMSRLKSAIGFNTFMVGLIKAPFMALVIGMIAAIEGFGVQGSAESLGRQVTASVVKAIFMVIVVDGLFAMFFAAIDY
ncbi:MAG: MlaE family lipid ABC transporter permease subunit, partial [Alphaproteobacteria bacterium]|nr:MlaE family lipid ABC transporter permease subunit [Alphaproteobacteria bacterium]